jgi:2-phosphosulfolactate phosphatase
VRVDTFFTGAAVDPTAVPGSTAVVIDVIRATSTILEALVNGARAVYPVASTEEAVQLAASLGRDDTLLCGERRGVMIEGFDLGNSPREYTEDRIGDKQLVMTTTNGTRAFVAVQGADHVVSAAFLNLSAAVDAVKDAERLLVVCAGKEGHFSMDDAVCAGMLIRRVLQARGETAEDVEMNDAGRAAVLLSAGRHVTVDFLASTAAGAALLEVDLGDDLPFVAQMDRHDRVPVMEDRVIRLPRR